MSLAVSTRDAARPGWFQRFAGRWGKLTPALLFLLVLILYPVGKLLSLSFQGPGGVFSLQAYERLFASSVYVQVMVVTLKISFWTTLATVAISYPVARAIARLPGATRNRLMFWVQLSFWCSFLIRTFGWMVLLNRNGFISQTLQYLQIVDGPIDLLYSAPSVIVGMTHAMVPLCILTMVPVMEGIDENLSKAGMTLGGRPGSVFWRIYFPLSLPGVTAGALLVFITSLGFFIVPAFLGSRHETMITQLIIEQVQEYLNWGFAGALSLLLLVAALVIFTIYDRLLGISTLTGSVDRSAKAGGGPGWVGLLGLKICAGLGHVSDMLFSVFNHVLGDRGTGKRRRSGRGLEWAVVLAILAFLILPALIMVPVSFTAGSRINWPPEGFSLRWYESLLASPVWLQAATRSVIVALGAAALAMLIGTPAAFAIARQKLPGRTLILSLVLSPLIIPRMVIAVALFYFYAQIGLVGSYAGLIVGHAVLAIPYVVITVMAVLKSYDTRYDQAAWNLGARPTQTLRFVTLPLIKGGLISAFLFALITSFDELTIALFVTGGLTTTLPKQMWDDAINVATPILAAASTLLLVFVAVITLLIHRLQTKEQK